jgi:hypothetical protein
MERIMTASTKQRTGYQVRNWQEYNKSLVNRGDITIWFDDAVLDNWKHENRGFKVGRPFTYSDTAIETLLMLREFFRLPYRQTEGLGRALVRMMGVEVAIPSYTLLAKRAGKVKVEITVTPANRPIDIVVDSTGLKVFGEGEWKVRQHGIGKRRTWRKLHLAVDPNTHQIVAEVLTGNDCHDGDKAVELVQQTDATVEVFYGDGAYDQWKVYNGLADEGVDTIIPPRRNAKIKQHGNSSEAPLPRDENLRHIRRDGRKAWKKAIGYHRRSLAETAMSRLKTAFGDKLKNRKLKNQITEAAIRCKLLNLFAMIGLPLSVWN